MWESPPGMVGSYRIERRLGSGGMGVVFLGRDRTTGAAAAVKLLRPEHAANPRLRERLRREVAAAGRVPRFCTAALLHADLDAEPPWMATEYIDAPTLDTVLLEQGKLTGEPLVTFAIGVAVALRAIHAHGVVHRDLKPSNILLSPVGPRVIDFGIAQVEGADTRLTRTGAVVGTPSYMAPEQHGPGPVTPAADVFAWASVVTYAATGVPPFGSGARYPGPDLGDLAGPLRELVAAALATDPAARPSAAELVDRLSGAAPAAAAQVLATAAAPPLPTRPRRRGRRRWLAPAAVAAALVIAVGAGAVALQLGDGAPPVPDEALSRQLATESLTTADQRRSMALALDAWAAAPTPEARGALLRAPVRWLSHPDNVIEIAYDRAGARLATGSVDGEVRVWDPATESVTTVSVHGDLVYGVAYAPDGTLASASLDGTMHVHDPDGRLRAELAVDGDRQARTVAFSPDGGLLAVTASPQLIDLTGSHQIRLWEMETLQPHGTLDLGGARPTALTFTSDGDKLLAVTGEPAEAEAPAHYRLRTWRTEDRVADEGEALGADQVVHIAVSPDGATLAVVGAARTIQLRSLTGEDQLRELGTHPVAIRQVAFSPDGRTLATITAGDHLVRLWDIATGDLLASLSGHDDELNAVAFAPNGRTLATGGSDGQVGLWPADPDDAIADVCRALGSRAHALCS